MKLYSVYIVQCGSIVMFLYAREYSIVEYNIRNMFRDMNSRCDDQNTFVGLIEFNAYCLIKYITILIQLYIWIVSCILSCSTVSSRDQEYILTRIYLWRFRWRACNRDIPV